MVFGPPPYPPLLPRVHTLIATELLSSPDIARRQNPGRFWWCRCLLIPTGSYLLRIIKFKAPAPRIQPQRRRPVRRRCFIPFGGIFSSIRLWSHTKFDKQDKTIIVTPVHWRPLLKMKMEAGENLPEEVLCCISEWCSVLEDRNLPQHRSRRQFGPHLWRYRGFRSEPCHPGTHSDYSLCTSFVLVVADPLFSLVPLLLIRSFLSTVWLYLFLLPFHLVSEFAKIWLVSIGVFIYPGFVAAGKEIEQPFGALHPSLCWLRRERLVDLGMFCQVIMTQDIESLQSALCLNAYLGPEEPELICHRSMTLTEATAHDEFKDISDEVGSL
ncbi:hypothetical protein B0H14DRAFT_3681528 [Mycena olivaceomarginata]|nr:hypothetical protein B0H14DRAFT_3681528 [Mycena olivaceomarginata]